MMSIARFLEARGCGRLASFGGAHAPSAMALRRGWANVSPAEAVETLPDNSADHTFSPSFGDTCGRDYLFVHAGIRPGSRWPIHHRSTCADTRPFLDHRRCTK